MKTVASFFRSVFGSVFRKVLRSLLLVTLLVDSAFATEIFLNSVGGIADDRSLGGTVVTEHGNTYTLQVPNEQSSGSAELFRTWSKGTSSVKTTVTYPRGVKLSNPVALNTGTSAEVVVVFGFKPESGYRMYRTDITDGVGSLSSHPVQQPQDVRSDCMQPEHLSLSAGLREQVAFASDCLIGEFSYTGVPRWIWREQSFHTVYAGIPPVINSEGLAHFVVRKGAGRLTHIYRALRSSIDISEFVGLPPEANTPLLEATVNGMVVLSDDSLLLSGSGGYLQVSGTTTNRLSSSAGMPWGAGNVVSTADSFYLPRLQDNQLNLEQVSYSGADSISAITQPLSINERLSPSTMNLVYDSGQLRLLHYAQGIIVKHAVDQFDGMPEKDTLTTTTSGGNALQSLEFPFSLLQAGANAYVKGFINDDHGTLLSLYANDSLNSPYQGNLRGAWGQSGADEQQTSSVPGGVEFLLTESVSRAALSCHPIDDPEATTLVPSGGVFLQADTRRLSFYHQEITGSSLFNQSGKGAYCQPVSLVLRPPEISESPEGSGSGNSLLASELVIDKTLGDKVLLGRVGSETIPLWVVDQPQVNGVISSEATRTTSNCLNGEQQCNGYRRLVLGGTDGQMSDNGSSVNVAAIVAVAGVAGLMIIVGIIVTILAIIFK